MIYTMMSEDSSEEYIKSNINYLMALSWKSVFDTVYVAYDKDLGIDAIIMMVKTDSDVKVFVKVVTSGKVYESISNDDEFLLLWKCVANVGDECLV